MEIQYKKDLKHNYMIISGAERNESEAYSYKLLQYQKVDGMLSVDQRWMDNKAIIYYDITAKQAMNTIMEKTALSFETVKQLCLNILDTVERAYEYLLPEDDFILAPEFIFFDIITNKPNLCLLPGYNQNIKEQMNSLIEYLMNKVDYNDREAVLLIYRLYAVSREEGFTFAHLKEALTKEVHADAVLPCTEGKRYHTSLKDTENTVVTEETTKEKSRKDTEEVSDSTKKESQTSLIDQLRMKRKLNTANKQAPQDENSKEMRIPVMMEKLESEEEVLNYPGKTYLYTGLCIAGGVLISILTFTSNILYNTFGDRMDYSKLLAFVLILACVEAYLLKMIWDKKNKAAKIIPSHEYVDPRQDFYRHESTKWDKQKKNDMDNKSNANGKQNAKQYDNQYDTDINHQNIDQDTCSDIYGTMSGNRGNSLGRDNVRNKLIRKALLQEDLPEEDNLAEQATKEDSSQEGNPTCLISEVVEDKAGLMLKPIEDKNYKAIVINDFPFFIGKLKKNVDYCLEKDVVSRYHAKITKEEEQLFITDLNSTNGTFVNQEAVQTYQKKEIRIGDEIAFANISYQLISD